MVHLIMLGIRLWAEGRTMMGRVHSWSTGGSPKRILIDSMIVDSILATSGFIDQVQRAAAQGALVIVETHILRDQLSDTPDPARRHQLLQVYEALPKNLAPTSAFILDVSRLDQGEVADDATAVSVSRLKTAKDSRGLKDALLAVTALGKADALVTEDKELQKRVSAAPPRCGVWGFDRFRKFVEDSAK